MSCNWTNTGSQLIPRGGAKMKIGVTGPIRLSPLLPYLELTNDEMASLPPGMAMTPLVHQVVELLARGEEVVVYTLDVQVDRHRIYQGPNLRIHVAPYRSRARHRALDFFETERDQIQQLILSDPPDIVHAHWTYEFALGAIASRVPHLVTAHDAPYSVLKYYPTLYRAIRLLMAYRVALSARHMTGVSPYLQRHFKRYFPGCPALSVVPNGLPEKDPGLVSDRSRSDGNGVVFATVLQGWGTRKNGEAALAAFQMTRKSLPDATLYMFGTDFGPEEPAHIWARERELTEGVVFCGHVEYGHLMNELGQNVDVLLHPALEEACPMAIIEAMRLGLPVIGGNRSGGVPWTVGTDAGLLVDIRSPRQIADAMKLLAEDTSMRHEMGNAGLRRAHERFSISAVVDQYMEIYCKILESQ